MAITHERQIPQELNADVLAIPESMTAWKEQLLQAEMIVISLVCSDSRVVLPRNVMSIAMDDGRQKNVLFIAVPTIGGGAPSRSRLRGVKQTLLRWGVAKEKISILVTQHGDTEEITNSRAHQECSISCGLRKFFSQHDSDLTKIRRLILPWTQAYKQKHSDKSLAPDRLPLEVLEKEAPEIMTLITQLHQISGLPRRLILRAAYRNTSFSMDDNLFEVWSKVAEYLQDGENADILATCFLGAANYDHQQKQLKFNLPYARLGFLDTTLQFDQLTPRSDRTQSPENVIISFGQEAICLDNSILLPHFAGAIGPSDNDFTADASILSEPTALCALAEAFYAVTHKVHPHKDDNNFADLKRVIIICDNTQYVDQAKKALKSKEFEEDFFATFSLLNGGNIVLVNLELDQAQKAPGVEIFNVM